MKSRKKAKRPVKKSRAIQRGERMFDKLSDRRGLLRRMTDSYGRRG